MSANLYVWTVDQQQSDSAPNPFGEYIAEAIKAAGFKSPTAFARQAGYDPSVVLRWINGKSHPSAAVLTAVAPTLGKTAAELIAAAYPDDGREGVARNGRYLVHQVKPDARGSLAAPPDADEVLTYHPGGVVDLAKEVRTRAGVAGHLRVDVFNLVELVIRSGLDAEPRLKVINRIRARHGEYLARLSQEVADDIREFGGDAPEVAWPPEAWLLALRERERAAKADGQ